MAELAGLYGGAVPADASIGEALARLAPVVAQWDFRRGGHRWSVPEASPRGDEEAAFAALGLRDARPPGRPVVDYTVVLGGARLSPLLRARLVARRLAEGSLRSRRIVLLGSTRPVAASERDATDTYAPGAETEFDLMTAGAVKELDGGGVSTLGVPWSKANSADSYRYFARRCSLAAGSRVLLVTSQIYVPYQHLEAARRLALPLDVELETIGFPLDWEAELQGMQRTSNFLQETRSAIQAAGRLHAEHLAFGQMSPATGPVSAGR